MRTLALDTATEACSVALFEGRSLLADRHEVLGRGHAEHLIPMVQSLPDNGESERILVSLGPGSFTGVRIGIAAARALGIAWRAEVLGFPSMALVAAQARDGTSSPVTVCMNGGHGEWFIENFDEFGAGDGVRSLTPADAKKARKHKLIAGNKAVELMKISAGDSEAIDMLPRAAMTVLLNSTVLGSDLTPIYGRAPDARPQAVRPGKSEA